MIRVGQGEGPDRDVQERLHPVRHQEARFTDRVADLHLVVPPFRVVPADVHPVLRLPLTGPAHGPERPLVQGQALEQVGGPLPGDPQEIDEQPVREPAEVSDTQPVQFVNEAGEILVRVNGEGRRRTMSVAAGCDPAQFSVEEMGGHVPDLPVPREGGPVPVRRVQGLEEADQFVEQGTKEPPGVERPEFAGPGEERSRHRAATRRWTSLPARRKAPTP